MRHLRESERVSLGTVDHSMPVYARAKAGQVIPVRASAYQIIPTIMQAWLALLVLVAGMGSAVKQHVNVPWQVPAAVVAVILARVMWKMMVVLSCRGTIDSARITLRRGVFNRYVHSVELARIQNVSSYQSWWQRLCGIGTVIIDSTDSRCPRVFLTGVGDPHGLRERLLRAGLATRHFHGTTETFVGAL